MTVRKQFIAGARCPACQAEDKVRYCRDGEREWLECVACGHETSEPQAPEHPSQPDASGPVGVDEVRVVRLR